MQGIIFHTAPTSSGLSDHAIFRRVSEDSVGPGVSVGDGMKDLSYLGSNKDEPMLYTNNAMYPM